MNFDVYKIIYLISNVIGTYIIFKYFSLFFEMRRKKLENFIVFLLYYIVIFLVYFLIQSPIAIMISNIALFLGISIIFCKDIKKCILSTFFIYIILIFAEIIVTLGSSIIKNPIINATNNMYQFELYRYLLNLFLMHLFSYTFYFIIRNYKELKSLPSIPFFYWVSVIIMPCVSIYIVMILIYYCEEINKFIMLGFVLLFLINFAAFYLFENLSIMYNEKLQKVVLEQQNAYYNNQLELFKTSLKSVRSYKHDLSNHLATINILLHKNEIEHAIHYIKQLSQNSFLIKEYARSGNVVIDSIINFKLQEAEEYDVIINVLLNIPEIIYIESFDMVIILGNLLDNALYATRVLDTNRRIDLRMSYNKGRLIIIIDNTFDGVVIYEGDKIVSKTKDKENHGIGIDNIRKSINNYKGTMDIEYTEELYTTSILLYVPNKSY